MNEIEVKAKVTNYTGLLKRIEELGCSLSEPIKQYDRIFIPKGLTIPVNPGVNVLRIRQQNNSSYLFTLKQSRTNELDCIEKELPIQKPEIMMEICELLGFFQVSHVNKIRRKAKYNDLEICLDEVEDLGIYIEVEKISDEDGLTIQKELWNFLISLGVKETEKEEHGYDILMKLKEEKIKKT